jgi:hypothetical protein
MNNRIWTVPVNDGEAVEIRHLLQDAGEQVLVTGQPWGATWKGLEAEVVVKLGRFRQENADGTIYGVELGGAPPEGCGIAPVVNVDHHKYASDDRSHPLSSLEQVAVLLGRLLSRYQRFVAANDVRYIPGMEALGLELGMSATETKGMIEVVRAADRAAQGVTPDDESQAVRDLATAEWSDGSHGRRVVVAYSTPSTTAHADRLYLSPPDGVRPAEQLYKGPKWIYFGPKHNKLHALGLPRSWAGGAPESGYFGIIAPDASAQEKIMAIFHE